MPLSVRAAAGFTRLLVNCGRDCESQLRIGRGRHLCIWCTRDELVLANPVPARRRVSL